MEGGIADALAVPPSLPPAEHFATYQPAEVMPKHAAPRITWTQRLKAWWNHLWRRRV